MAMEPQKIIEKIKEKYGEDRFTGIVLKIYAVGTITELNFNQKDIDEIILPLVQLGLLDVDNKYFRERPDENKTRYNLFSVSYKGEKLVKYTLEKFDIPKKVKFFVDNYPPKFLAFAIHFFISQGSYYGSEEEEYEKLLNTELIDLINNFKKDVKKLMCAFLVIEYTSKKAEIEPPALILLPDFRDSLENELPSEIIAKEMDEFDLTDIIESYFLKPQAKKGWYEAFLRNIEKSKLQNLWRDWSEDLTANNVIIGQVVLDAGGLREFLKKKIEKIQSTLVESAGVEKKAQDFLRVLETAKVVLNESDKSDIMACCENRKDFSIFISAMYKILHDHMHIKDPEAMDPIRCYFHHARQDRRHESNILKFQKFCENFLISFEPKNDEWKILKERILERAIEKIGESI